MLFCTVTNPCPCLNSWWCWSNSLTFLHFTLTVHGQCKLGVAYKARCTTNSSNKFFVGLYYAHMYIHPYHREHHPDLKDKIPAELSEELLSGEWLIISVFFLLFSYLKINYYRVVLCWLQPVCEDCVSWKSPLFLPSQSCCVLWPATFYQGDWLFSWLQNGTWKGISSQYCQTKDFKDSGCNNRVLRKDVRGY